MGIRDLFENKATDAKEEEFETYSATWICDNCEEEQELEVPKGVTIEEFALQMTCDNCGCKLEKGE